MLREIPAFLTILAAESRLGIPLTFYCKLLAEPDDWSFTVKTHALFEGALHKAIETRLRWPQACKRANIQDWQRRCYRDKLQLALKLEILEEDYFLFLSELGKLRNRLVHNLKYINLSLHQYGCTLKGPQLEHWNRAMGAGFKGNLSLYDYWSPLNKSLPAGHSELPPEFWEITKQISLRQGMVATSPRGAIWYAGVWTLDLLSASIWARCIGNHIELDPQFHPNVQDLLLDPAVLEFKKALFSGSSSINPDTENHLVCSWLLLRRLHEDAIHRLEEPPSAELPSQA